MFSINLKDVVTGCSYAKVIAVVRFCFNCVNISKVRKISYTIIRVLLKSDFS